MPPGCGDSPRAKRSTLLAFSAGGMSWGTGAPTTLRTLTDDPWMLISGGVGGRLAVVENGDDDILLVELAEVLARGQPKIDLIVGGPAQACVIPFDAISSHLYCEVARHILVRVGGRAAVTPADGPAISTPDEMHPIVFRSTIPAGPAGCRRPPVAGGVRFVWAQAGACRHPADHG